ncbi:hypothetical protein RFI_30853 [Reticulomyxa filosa]|uniref:Uncharacterized protein n=1 Tax=Reticulomyxa filosa TaxID=46433 RepID=X6LY49_RETFI|nr:hypothetical protein RFI_30853 [Reticulomyxa filosa]|eukprot:ETO06539.1 hypothetical protein RFI_30853 [Reticulomyxa filosa]
MTCWNHVWNTQFVISFGEKNKVMGDMLRLLLDSIMSTTPKRRAVIIVHDSQQQIRVYEKLTSGVAAGITDAVIDSKVFYELLPQAHFGLWRLTSGCNAFGGRAQCCNSTSSTNDSNNNSNNVSTVTLSNAVTMTQDRNRFDGKESDRLLDLIHELALTSDTTTLTAISETVTLYSQDEHTIKQNTRLFKVIKNDHYNIRLLNKMINSNSHNNTLISIIPLPVLMITSEKCCCLNESMYVYTYVYICTYLLIYCYRQKKNRFIKSVDQRKLLHVDSTGAINE